MDYGLAPGSKRAVVWKLALVISLYVCGQMFQMLRYKLLFFVIPEYTFIKENLRYSEHPVILLSDAFY